jgi:hypothetical protein
MGTQEETHERTVENVGFLVVVWLGMAAFVLIHSFVLLRAMPEQSRVLFRTAWFVGLGFVAVALAYFSLSGESTALET